MPRTSTARARLVDSASRLIHASTYASTNTAAPAAAANISRSEAPIYTGRAVAALAADPKVMEKTGTHITVKELDAEYGFSDSPESNRRAGT